jgi:hypothetical protein
MLQDLKERHHISTQNLKGLFGSGVLEGRGGEVR